MGDGILSFNLANQNVIMGNGCGASCPMLRVKNVLNPPYGSSYSVRVLVFGNGATSPTREFNATLVVPVPGFTASNAKIAPIANNAGGSTALYVEIVVQDSLPAGVKNGPDPFVAYSYIELWFRQMSMGRVMFA